MGDTNLISIISEYNLIEAKYLSGKKGIIIRRTKVIILHVQTSLQT